MPFDAEDIVPTLYGPKDFAALYYADKEHALALLAAMTEPQRVRLAHAHAAWLAYHGLAIDLETVLAAWGGREGTVVARMSTHAGRAAPTPSVRNEPPSGSPPKNGLAGAGREAYSSVL